MQRVIIFAVHIFCYFVVFLVTDVCLRPRLEVLTALNVKPDLGELFRHNSSLRRILQRRDIRKILKFIE